MLESTATVQNEIQAIFFKDDRIQFLFANSFRRYNMLMHRFGDVTLHIKRYVYVVDPHNIYSANLITDTRTVESETSLVGVMLPPSRTEEQEAVGCP